MTIVNGAYKPTNITGGPHIVSPMVLVSIMPELVINQPSDVHQLYPGFSHQYGNTITMLLILKISEPPSNRGLMMFNDVYKHINPH